MVSTLQSKSPKIVICGNYGASNLGDEAILDGILRLIRQAAPNAQITVMSNNPAETEQMHEVSSVKLFPAGIRSFWRALTQKGLMQTVKAVKNCDLFILGGGGLFTDERPLAILIWSIQAGMARFFRRPIYCLGQSVGPLMTFFGRIMTRRIFKMARVITVRDASSAIILQKLDIHEAHVLADPVFFLGNASEDSQEIAEASSPSALRENFVVISVRPWSPHDQLKLKNLAQFIDWLYQKKGLETVLIPFQIIADNDIKPMQEICNNVVYKDAVQIFEYSADYRDTLKLMAKAKAVIGMRLHSLIFATLTETPFLALSYSQKVVSFVHALEQSDYLLKWSHFEAEDLRKNFEQMMNQHEIIQGNLAEKKRMSKNLVGQNVKYIRDLLSNSDLHS